MFLQASRLALVAASLNAAPALAYVGPGAGLTAIGTMIAVIAAILLAVIGFVWYPLKRMIRNRRAARAEDDTRGTE
jgi:hypothetical protein